MGQTLRDRLFLNGLAIVLVGMGLAGFLFWQAAESLYLDNRKENMLAQAELTAASLQGQALPAVPADTYSQVSNVMPGIHTRVIAPEGAVIIGLPLVSSGTAVQMPPAEDNAIIPPEELLKRPEIQSALQGIPAAEIRSVLNGTRRVMYAAAPLMEPDGSISGIAYLAEPLPRGGLPAEFFLQLTVALLAAAALALAAGWFLSRRISHPVTEVISAAGRVSEGSLDSEVSSNSGIRELDELGGAFNRMAASLKRSDRAQQAFVADVAHELRTPLTVIKGTIETLEDGAWDDVEGRGRLVSSMQNETDRLIRLVNDLLVLTRADAGMLKLNIQPVDLGRLVRQRCACFEPVAGQKKVTFEIETQGSSRAKGDSDRLAQVIDNLLDNALRYSPENGIISITIQSSDCGERVCSIHDEGPGIPAEHLARLFDRFYRVETSRSKRGGEAGLGLSIVRSLLAAQGGSITAESAPVKGTTLIFRLPALPD
jgi:signal transduction histidine kinase